MPNIHGFKHGYAGTKVWRQWKDMRRRCNIDPWYANRIKVCERWNSFLNFLADMGEPPPGGILGRIDHSKDYSPDNCRWEIWNRTPGTTMGRKPK